MTTTKKRILRAFYKWLEECPVEFQFQMEWMNDKDINSMDEMYKFIVFRNIPNTEIIKEKS